MEEGRRERGEDWARYGGWEDEKGIGLGETWSRGGGKGDMIGQNIEEGKRKRG